MYFNFERLEIWQLSRQLTILVFERTQSTDFLIYQDLIRQIRKSCISIFSNIAEGSARTSIADRRKFISIAYSSAIEALSQLILCNDFQIICDEDYEKIRQLIEN